MNEFDTRPTTFLQQSESAADTPIWQDATDSPRKLPRDSAKLWKSLLVQRQQKRLACM